MRKIVLRRVAFALFCVCSAVAADESSDSDPAFPAAQLTALTDEQLREILSSAERQRADAFEAASGRAQSAASGAAVGSFTFTPSGPSVRYSGVTMGVDTDEQEFIVEWYVGF